MKKYILFTIFFLFIMSGCEDEGETAAGTASPTPQPTPIEISMGSLSADSFAYNPSENSLSLWIRKKKSYSMYTLKKDNQWFGPVVSWKAPPNCIYDNFVYGSDGSLYACQKQYSKSTLKKQTLVKLRKNKKVAEIPLRNLPQKEITGISFSGTALALTFDDGNVRFYNIAEGLPLGASNIKGSPGKNMLREYFYFTEEKDSATGETSLIRYDIRTGERERTYPLGTGSAVPASNYRETLYLLLPNGIYIGNTNDSSLLKQLDYSSLALPDRAQITFFQAARDDALYLGFYDSEHIFHLRIVTLSPLCYRDKHTNT